MGSGSFKENFSVCREKFLFRFDEIQLRIFQKRKVYIKSCPYLFKPKQRYVFLFCIYLLWFKNLQIIFFCLPLAFSGQSFCAFNPYGNPFNKGLLSCLLMILLILLIWNDPGLIFDPLWKLPTLFNLNSIKWKIKNTSWLPGPCLYVGCKQP